MGNYELLGRADLARADADVSSQPFGTPGVVVLPDGTFFVSIWIETEPYVSPAVYTMRLWHLAPDLSVLGTVDVPYSEYYFPIALPTGTMKVISLRADYRGTTTPANCYSTVIDCSGPIPIPGVETLVSTLPGSFAWSGNGGPMPIMDYASNRAMLITNGCLRVIDLTTGLVLGEVANDMSALTGYYTGPVAFAVDPTDDTKYIARDSRDANHEFTVTSDNVVTFNSASWLPYPANKPHGASGSGFSYTISGAVGFGSMLPATISQEDGPVSPSWPDGLPLHQVLDKTYTNNVLAYYQGVEQVAELDLGKYYGYTHVIASQRDDGLDGYVRAWDSDGYVNVTGPTSTMQDGRHLVTFYEHGIHDSFYGTPAILPELYGTTRHYNPGGKCEYRLRLAGLDQEDVASGFEVIDLDYFDEPPIDPVTDSGYGPSFPPDADGVSLWAGSFGLAVDQQSGMMLVGCCTTTHYSNQNVYVFMVWAIQGPAGKPNLAGDLYDDRVRFTP